jgi:RNA polymerase II elongation factor ELL
LPGQRKGAAKAANKKLLAGNRLGADNLRSTPVSPALSGVGSPALAPTSVPLSQVTADKAKASRKPVIHLLATGPMTKAALREALPDVSDNDFDQALEKVADAKGNKWELTKKFWRELDVWTYDYANQEDRQRAIDNAVSKFDNLRLGVTEPEWDRLLPKAERGQGKCLSKLQAQIAQGTARPPKIKLQKDEGSGRDTSAGEEDDSVSSKAISKVKRGEPAARSSSQPAAVKPKKASEKEAQTKRLLSNKLNKPIVKPAAKPAASPRPAPAPAKKEKAAKSSGKKVLSSELIVDSDEEADQASQPLQTKPSQPSKKPLPKPVQAKKRPRDEETETSDSSIPLSKKVRKDVPPPPQRVASASQASNATSNSTVSSHSLKNKNTSPHKSSPLASSPPTNASEVDNNSGHRTASSSSASPAPYIGNKTSRSPIHKRHHKSSSVTSSSSSNGSTRYLKAELVDVARKYRSFYPKYEELHRELANSRYRDMKKEKDLLEMHERLAKMKQMINEGIVDM